MNSISNVYGWSISDRNFRKFYYDNWSYDSFSSSWNFLWKEIISKFKLVVIDKPSITLTSFISCNSELKKIEEKEIDVISKNSLFYYSWRIKSFNDKTYTGSIYYFYDILSCYNEMIDYVIENRMSADRLKIQILLEYEPFPTNGIDDISTQRSSYLSIPERFYSKNCHNFDYNNIDVLDFTDDTNSDEINSDEN